MRVYKSSGRVGKRILLFVAMTAVGYETATGATLTFNNGAGDHIWNLLGNWSNPLETPGPIDTAILPIGLTGASDLFITDTGSLADTASVGTLTIDLPSGTNAYRILRASTGSRPSQLTFGTGTLGGALTITNGSIFTPNFNLGGGDGTLTVQVPTGLAVSLPGDTGGMTVQSIIQGAGLVSFSNNASGEAEVVFDERSQFSTWTGGSRIDADVEVNIMHNTLRDGSGNHTGGPLGAGTCNLNGGTLNITGSGTGSFFFDNDINVTANSSIFAHPNGPVSFPGEVRTNGNRLTIYSKQHVNVFENAGWSSADTGTLAIGETNDPVEAIDIRVDSGTSIFGGAVGEGTTGQLLGTVTKLGNGVYGAKHFRAGTLSINGGTLRVNAESTGTLDQHVSRVNTLTLAGGASPTVQLDLMNNEFIIDYSGTSPLSGGTNSIIFDQITAARGTGSWTGNGITSSVAAAGSSNFGVGYGEAEVALAMGSLTSGTFASQTVDDTTVLLRLTYLGDANLT